MSAQENKKRKHIQNSQETSDGFHSCTPKISNNEVFEEQFVDKSRFEEIEDKLEEMFAGIEDEHIMNSKPFENNVPKKCGYSNNNYVESNLSGADEHGKNEFLTKKCLKYNSILKKCAIPTKAAKKSSNLTCTESATQLNPQTKDYNQPPINSSIWYLKSLSPERRPSIEVNEELVQLSVNINDDRSGKKADMTLFPLNVGSNREVAEIETNILKDKLKTNNQKKDLKCTKEIINIKSNTCSNRKIVRKSETPAVRTKYKQHKLKHMRMYHLLSSENETEEKHLLTRDIENKSRSPFILVKSNGCISVVNTIPPDDSTEKLTRLRKPNNYAHERNSVKGCHSSTLSNRYDADTADSSWKCIFCKIGPHRKGLGDLFGPYLISSNCDEFRSTKSYLENLQKFRRNHDLHNFGFPNKSIKCINETPYSHIRNISEYSIYTLGMSRVSAGRYEIWVHEECAIWAPSLFVVGSRLVGLEAATWSSIRYECVLCLKQGALLCCLHRGCKSSSHLPCARELKWFLDESRLWIYCSKHTLSKF